MHTKQPRFKLTRQAILLGLIFAAYPMTGSCVAAGRADFVIGNVEAITADGSRRMLSKGSAINEGDAINTAAGARAQLRFIDGGYVSLQPDTRFRVDQFNYKNKTDGSEKGFFSLLKGSLRAITGSIGHTNHNTYKVMTATATIGIRGTGYKAEIRDDGLFVSVGEGAVMLSNNAGTLVVTNGRAAFVANINTMPSDTQEHPRTPPASIQQLTGTSATALLPALPKMTSGSGYTMAYAYQTAAQTGGSASISGVTATFNNSGQGSQLTQYNSPNDSSSLGAAGVTFAATDGIVGWGRWDGISAPTAGPMTTNGASVFHYVIGQPTAVMPTSGTATYNLMGYTNPTASNGSTGWNVTGNLSANFATANVGITMQVRNSTTTFNISGGVNNRNGANFTDAGTLISGIGGCVSICTTTINGFFIGANTSRAGLSYQISDSITQLTVRGTAAFTSTTPPPL